MNKFQCVFSVVFRELDNFKNGCNGETFHDYDLNIVVVGESIPNLITNIQSRFNVNIESILINDGDENGRLDVQTMTKTKSGTRDVYKKYECEFRNGDLDLWLNYFIGEVSTISTIVDLSDVEL